MTDTILDPQFPVAFAAPAPDLIRDAPVESGSVAPGAFAGLRLSVGIALRSPGGQEGILDLTRRADMAIYGAKRAGGRHWRVSTEGDA
jgi:GGDEF domain-containing protein